MIATVALLDARLDALFRPLAEQPHEVAVFAYLAADGSLLGARHVTSGRRDTITVPVRAVAADALAFDAAAAVMAHNHPSGVADFSPADLALTRRLSRALAALDVRLLDHWLLTRGGCTRLSALSLI